MSVNSCTNNHFQFFSNKTPISYCASRLCQLVELYNRALVNKQHLHQSLEIDSLTNRLNGLYSQTLISTQILEKAIKTALAEAKKNTRRFDRALLGLEVNHQENLSPDLHHKCTDTLLKSALEEAKKNNLLNSFNEYLYILKKFKLTYLRNGTKPSESSRISFDESIRLAIEVIRDSEFEHLDFQLVALIEEIFEIRQELGFKSPYNIEIDIDILTSLSFLNYSHKEFENALYYGKQIIKLFKQIPSQKQANCHMYLGGIYQELKKYSEVIAEYQRAIDVRNKTEDTSVAKTDDLINFHTITAIALVTHKDFEKALNYIIGALRIIEDYSLSEEEKYSLKIRRIKDLSKVLLHANTILRELPQHIDSKEWHSLIEIHSTKLDKDLTDLIKSGEDLIKSNEFGSALKYFTKISNDLNPFSFKEIESTLFEARDKVEQRIQNLIVSCHALLDKKQWENAAVQIAKTFSFWNAYSTQKNTSEAKFNALLKKFPPSLNQASKDNPFSQLADLIKNKEIYESTNYSEHLCWLTLTDIYKYLGDEINILTCIENGIECANAINSPFVLSPHLKNYGSLLITQKKYKEAFAIYNLHNEELDKVDLTRYAEHIVNDVIATKAKTTLILKDLEQAMQMSTILKARELNKGYQND